MSESKRPHEHPSEGDNDPVKSDSHEGELAEPERRDFLSRVSTVAMGAGLTAAYGGLGLLGARYLYPPGKRRTAWMYVADLGTFNKGKSRPFKTPGGERVMIARTGDTGEVSDFVALSSTCPHLGCQVHWEANHNRFFCPCHNGTFDPGGNATGGPPAEAKQSLPKYPLKIEKGLLYIEVAVESLPAEGRNG
ncbi:MAG: Rieske (2Fe-2S) protein [Polyangiaceae bacterium]|nr:Rieske (2Fe-2S) protein [Polyangiaceae bacterium]